jgi:hypothetical protein
MQCNLIWQFEQKSIFRYTVESCFRICAMSIELIPHICWMTGEAVVPVCRWFSAKMGCMNFVRLAVFATSFCPTVGQNLWMKLIAYKRTALGD